MRHVPIAISEPELSKGIPEEYIWTESKSSEKKVRCTCINCGNDIGIRKIRSYVNSMGRCVVCADGFSLGAKLMLSVLTELAIHYGFLIYTEKTFDWCKFTLSNGKKQSGRYDFYFCFNKREYIVEIDGGFHVQDNTMSGQTKELSKEIDDIKDNLAVKHGIEVIRVKTVTRSVDVIRHRIENSKLSDIFDMKLVNWNNVYHFLRTPLLYNIAEKWNQGMSCSKICEETGLAKQTINIYLKRCRTIGIVENYNEQETRKRGDKSRSVTMINSQPHVIRINDNREWISITSCAKELKVNPSTIKKACDKRTYVGTLFEGEPAYIMYKDDYLNNGNQVDLFLLKQDGWIGNDNRYKTERCVCLNDRNKFLNKKAASDFYNIKECRIIDNILNRSEHLTNGMVFVSYDDFLKMTEEDISKKLNYRSGKLILLNTLQVFASAVEASKSFDLNGSTISRHMTGKALYAGFDKYYHDGLVFKYIEDYKPEDKIELRYYKTSAPIVCLDDMKIFYNIHSVNRYLGTGKTYNFMKYRPEKIKKYEAKSWQYINDYFDEHQEIHNQISFYREHLYLDHETN